MSGANGSRQQRPEVRQVPRVGNPGLQQHEVRLRGLRNAAYRQAQGLPLTRRPRRHPKPATP